MAQNVTSERVSERMAALGLDQSELARRVNCSSAAINQIVKGHTQNSRFLPVIASRLGVPLSYLLGETDDPDDWSPPAQPANDNVIEVPWIDLQYGMGGTFLDEEPVQVRTEPFPLALIRRYTRARADQLVFAEGMGDSMAPTITPNDLMLIDQSDNSLRLADQIWAFSFGGVGMIKRLRPRPDGSIAILSDNPNVPEDRAVDDELFLIGRVVAKVSKL